MPHPRTRPSAGHEPFDLEPYHANSKIDEYLYSFSGDPESIPRSHQFQEAPMLDRTNNYSNQSNITADSYGEEYCDVDPRNYYTQQHGGSFNNFEDDELMDYFPSCSSGMNYSWDENLPSPDNEMHLVLHQDETHSGSQNPESRRAGHSGRQRRDSDGQADTGEYVCLLPGCKTKPFKRPADLHRHYKYKHETKHIDRIPCDYKKCTRNTEPFTRLDHCRDHYRDFHHEDLPRRGNDQQSETINVNPKWWRCVKCLDRIMIGQDGWQCPRCKKVCDNDRRRNRGYAVRQ